MPVIPGGNLHGIGIQEGGLDAVGGEEGLQQARGGILLVVVHHQVHGVAPDQELLLHQLQGLFHVPQGIVLHVLIAEGQQPAQEGVPHGHGGPVLDQRSVGRIEIMVDLPQRQDLVLGPGVSLVDPGQLAEPVVGAGLGKEEVIDTGLLREGAVFKIGDVGGIVRPLGNDPGDVGLDVFRSQALHDADALVSLDEIVFAHVFQHLGGIPQALLFHALAEGGPLDGELGVHLQNGHEIVGEGEGAAPADGAHHPGEGNGLDPQAHAVQGIESRNLFLQNGQIGILIVVDGLGIGLQAFLACFCVIFNIHGVPFIAVIWSVRTS